MKQATPKSKRLSLAEKLRRFGGDDSPPCPEIEKHTPAPTGYLGWHHWAEQKGKTHRQIRCPGCGLYKIWKPK